MLKIGLTGGIGSGKSAASDYFARLGADVIDTDLLSREVVARGTPGLQQIVQAFGEGVLTDARELDRHALRKIVFEDNTKRKQLEAILHPRIRELMLQRAARSPGPYVVFVIPLLFETGQQALVDRVLVVDVPEALQRRRVAARDQIGDAQISQILNAQVDRQTRLQGADDVVSNDANLDHLQRQIEKLDQRYRAMASL